MSEMTHEDALAHFGVKGMKWGQHKSPPEAVRSRAQIRERVTKRAHVTARVINGARLAVIGGILMAPTLQHLANHAVNSKIASNGAKAAANLFADKNGIANHKLIDLGWDAVTGSWK